MEPVFTVNPIPFEPLAWPQRPSSERLAASARTCDPGAASCVVEDCDARWCGVVLEAARKEIDLLRRGVVPRDVYEPAPDADEPPPGTLAAPPQTRKAYAPAPIGAPTPLRSELPPDQPAAQTAALYYVTNLGTLLDVLA